MTVANSTTMDLQGDRDFINSLTTLFLSEKSKAKYVSLRLWIENGEVRYFLTNTPRRVNHRNDQARPRTSSNHSNSPTISTPAWESSTESSRNSKQRRPCRPSPTSPEVVRDAPNLLPEALDTSDMDNARDRDLAFSSAQSPTPVKVQARSSNFSNNVTASVSVHNRFDVLDPDVRDDDHKNEDDCGLFD